MDHSRLLNSQPRELALYLRAVAPSLSTQVVTKDLLARIENDSIPPRVFAIWCTASGDAAVVQAGLNQSFSRLVQRAAIRRFGQLIRSPRPDLVWDAIGGTAGVLDFLSRTSVSHVRLFSKELGRSGNRSIGTERRRPLVDELAQILHQRPSSGQRLELLDHRPLQEYYLDVLPACSPQIRRAITGRDDLSNAPIAVRREHFLRALAEHGSYSNGLDNTMTLLDDHGSESGPPELERLSSNMLFAMNLLETLSWTDLPAHTMSRHVFYDQIILPLFRRMARWKTKSQNVASAVRSLVRYRQRHGPQNFQAIDLSQRSIIRYFICRWIRHPDELEQSLQSLLALVPDNVDHARTTNEMIDLIRMAPLHLRARLLQLALRHLRIFSADITSDEELQSLHFRWPPSFFFALPKHYARQLLSRVIDSKPANSWTHWTAADGQRLRVQHRGDPTCLLLLLSNEEPESIATSRDVIEKRKSNAEKARPQPDRAFWAQCALDCAIASGSVGLYRDTLLWATRFRKDPLTVKEIFSSQSLHTYWGIDLLRGFPGCHLHVFPAFETIKQRIRTANQLCLELLQSACEALKEPSFNRRHWLAVSNLFREVVSSRVQHVPLLQSKLKLTDEDIYDLVFTDTLECAIDLELLRMKEINAQLGMGLYGDAGGYRLTTNRAALRFADELAKRRDEIWEAYRQREHPATLEISRAYPRGLPLQFESTVDPSNRLFSMDRSFMRKRAENIVFMEPSLALAAIPEDQDVQNAIGVFVDEWKWALQTYVALSADAQESALSAWNHTLGPLSLPRMSAIEAFVFWSAKFKNALGRYDVHGPWEEEYLDKLPLPRVPTTEDENTTEWHPDLEIHHYVVKSRRLTPTNLDAMIDAQRDFSSDPRATWRDVDARLPSGEQKSLWQRYKGRHKIEASLREALICSALAYLSEEITAASGTFSKPFPPSTVGNIRYPGLYLDDDFLKRHQRQAFQALHTLKRFRDDVPPTLLLKIVTLAFKKEYDVDDGPPPMAFELLRLLVEGDRPQLALDLLQHLVLDRPSDSAWQRKLFSQGTMKALPAETVRLFMDSLSKGIRERLAKAKAASASAEKTKETSFAETKPFIKVTTVKMLAQLLAGAEFIDERSTVEVLIGLLRQVLHHDIRVAVVQAMLQVLISTKYPNFRVDILNSLLEHAVPIMANINERQPVSEEMWQEYERSPAALPEASIRDDHIPPMLSAVMTVANMSNVADEIREQLFERVLLPTLDGLVVENSRWMKCFFRHMDLPCASLPDCPVHPMLLSELLASVEFAPAYILELWLGMFAFSQTPPQHIKALHARTEEVRELSDYVGGDYWRSFWKDAQALAHTSRPAQLLKKEFSTKVPDGISHEKLQETWLKQTDITLRRADIKLRHQNTLLQDLSPPSISDTKALGHWKQYCRPLVQALVQRVDAIRTPSWQRDTNRVPNLLPDLTTPRRWLMLFPEEQIASLLEHTFSVIMNFLNEMGTAKRLYAERYQQLVAQVKNMGLESSVKIGLGIKLGTIPNDHENLSTAEYLRVEFALELLKDGGDCLRGEKNKVLKLLNFWTGHVDEDVRLAGLRCAESLQKIRVWGANVLEGDEFGV